MSKNTGSFILGAVVGGVAAATAALLLAPKEGKVLREDLKKQFDDILAATNEYTELAKEKFGNLEEHTKDLEQDVKKSSTDIINNLKQQKEDMVDHFVNITEDDAEEDFVIDLDDQLANFDTDDEYKHSK